MGETASDVAAVVWDIDGTLCDSFRLAYGATVGFATFENAVFSAFLFA